MERRLSAAELESALGALTEEHRRLGLRDPAGVAQEALSVLDGALAAEVATASDVDRSEAMAMGALLGRRLATLGISPTLTLAILDGIEGTARQIGAVLEGVADLRAVVMEGYARGLEEKTTSDLERRIAEQVEVLTMAPGLVLVSLPYLEDVERMGAAMDAVGRILLARDVKACVIWAQGPVAHREEASLAGIAGLVEHARMIGSAVAVVAPDPHLRDKIAARLDDTVRVQAALGPALEGLGYAVGARGSLLTRWFR